MAKKNYEVNGVPLDQIRNRNELRVIKLMPIVLSEFLDYKPDYLDIQDIYALALNNLAPRYIQQGSIVMREPVKDDEIIRELRLAIRKVEMQPTSREKGLV